MGENSAILSLWPKSTLYYNNYREERLNVKSSYINR